MRKRMVCVLLTVCLLLGGTWALADEEASPLRVGVFSLGQFLHIADDGAVSGYYIDYLEKLAGYTHRRYQYVACGNWEHAKDMLEAGELDLLAPAQRVDTLLARFDFTSLSMGIEAAAIFTNADRDDLLYEDFGAMSGLTIGVPAGVAFETAFVEEYVPLHGITPQVKEYANTTELLSAVKAREVDAVVTNLMFAEPDLKLLSWFSPAPIYLMVAKGNSALLEEIDSAMIRLMMDDPSFIATLESTYFPIYSSDQLTYEEQQLIGGLPEIKVGYIAGRMPISDKDSQTGELTGITRDVLDAVADATGLRFTYVPLAAETLTTADMQRQGIYLVCGVEDNELSRATRLMRLSTPYLSSERVLVAGSNLHLSSGDTLRVALPAGTSSMAQLVTAQYPGFQCVTYDSVAACFQAVCSGEAEALILNRYIAEYQLSNPRYADLKITPIRLFSGDLCIAALSLDDSELCRTLTGDLFLSVLDKAILQMGSERLNNIIIDNTVNHHPSYTFADFFSRYGAAMIAALVLVAVAILSLLHAQRVTRRKNRELAGKNVQLSEAVAQADRASTAKSQFLSRMSHEIRTPMNAIVGLTAIAKHHEQEPERIDDYLGKIETSSRVLLNIINDVLDMSAIESNKLKISNAQFDMKQVLTSIATIYYPQCQSKGVTFRMRTDLEHELLMGDSLRVNQILLNLVSNAYKFTDKGGSITVSAQETRQEDSRVFVRFQVTDTGCGMSDEMKSRLFRPFEQESTLTAQKHGGSGLGLSIAKNLVDMMHGAVGVESQIGQGTTFTVDLPFEAVPVQTSLRGALAQLRVLTVDDDPASNEYACIVLKRVGVQYDSASTGAEALRRIDAAEAEGQPYDVCLVDWRMPDMNGAEVTRRIRAAGHKTTVIIVSSYDQSEMEAAAEAAGADHYVTKPLFQSTLINVLTTLSGGGQPEAPQEPDKYDFTGLRVLMAEDNEMNAEIAIELLGMVHLDVTRAENGQKAVALFEQSSPGDFGAILMDIQMPVMDGYAATRAIRALTRPDAKTIPIIAMTANAFTEDVAAALSCGMNGHVAKPIETDALFATLDKALHPSA